MRSFNKKLHQTSAIVLGSLRSKTRFSPLVNINVRKGIMKRPIMIAALGVILCIVLWTMLDGGYFAIRRWYGRTNIVQRRHFRKNIRLMAAHLEESQRRPSDVSTNLHIDFNDWGHPIQYEWEDGVAVLRGAGQDRTLHTKDDVSSTVALKKRPEGISNQ